MNDYKELKVYKKCRDCAFYDATPFPEYNGRLAKCKNPNCDFIGAGKIGYNTLANRKCFTEKAGTA